jgi:Ca2+-binding RTX toxin-like protein
MTTFTGTKFNDTLFGSGLSDLLLGFAGNDSLTGDGGADTLDGGTGADTLQGGAGDDSYVIDSAADTISDGAGSDDRVLASITIDLDSPDMAGIEHATLTGTGGLNATGNAGANMLIGNAGANELDGLAGADTMIGGAGADTYEVDNSSDVVIENPGEGTDQVNSSASFFLGGFVEHLTLTGTDSISGYGNALANKITGNASANSLFGREGNDTLTGNDGGDYLDGGVGADKLIGGTGNDDYKVDDAGDRVVESGPSTDVDSVQSFITYTLGKDLEELFLLGDAAIDGTGNSLDNLIEGTDKGNVLSGLDGNDSLMGQDGGDLLMGGIGDDTLRADGGEDTLVGGVGIDVFVFSDTSLDGVDVIADYDGMPGGDVLDLRSLLVDFDPDTDDINDFLRTSIADGNTTLQIDIDGGGDSFVDLAVLQGVSTDLAALTETGTVLGVGTTGIPLIPGVNLGTPGDDWGLLTIHGIAVGLGGDDFLGSVSDAATLDGGAGADTLAGSFGDDTFVVDNAKDLVDDPGDPPYGFQTDLNDRLLASITIDLGHAAFTGADIEHVTLTGTAALNATGNAGANMLIGNYGANKLDGKAGDDTMIGRGGDDTYEVGSEDDVVIEYAGEGTDLVNSAAPIFALDDYVENLTLTGTADIDGEGNSLGNKITGNAGDNGLDGRGGNDTLTGNNGDDDLDGGIGADSLVGGKGSDTYHVDDVADVIAESGPSTDVDEVVSSIDYTLGTTLEHLSLDPLGSGDIDGTGNTRDNTITGNLGSNVLSGLAGNDSLAGADGDDLLLGGAGNDTLAADGGTDFLVGGAGSDVFQITLASLGFDRPDTIGDLDALPGGDTIDMTCLLDGFDPATDDINDFLRTSTADGSTIINVDANGTAGGPVFLPMAVLQGVSTDLAGLLANGTITGVGATAQPAITGTSVAEALAGSGTSDLILGLGGNDTLTGDAGADTLDGGTGLDLMTGGAGNDSYVVDNAKDVISESGGDTDDRILASVSIDLKFPAYAGVEHVTLTGKAAFNATGNDLDNLLVGNVAANTLDGKAGDDTLIGNAGDDIYEVDSAADAVIEYAGEGTDQVNSSVDRTLFAFTENLTLTGSGDIVGIGNDLANRITGNAGANGLEGKAGNDTLTGNDGADDLDGGAGADSMVGGSGNDVYVVDNVGDILVESGPTFDLDEVRSTITHTLGANLELLDLLGTDAIDGTGNTLGNGIGGNAANNVLSGLTGDDSLSGAEGDDLLLGGGGLDRLFAAAGVDTLGGGAGSDAFVATEAGLDGLDVIADFDALPGGDLLDLADLLIGFDAAVDNVNDFLSASAAGGSTTIQVDRDGQANGVAFVDMVVLQGVSTDVSGLLNNGSLALD